ncbi:coiled-coil domain-containing protein [Yinghuangia aomiensis]
MALLCAVLFAGQAAAAPDPGRQPLEPFNLATVQTQLQDLYRQAEQATERYNASNERRGTQQVKVNDIRAGIVWTQQQIAESRDEIGRIARLQYTTRGVDPLMSLMLSSNPQQFLQQAPTFARISQSQEDTIRRQKQAEQQLKNMQKSEDAQLAESARLEEESQKAKTDIETKVAEAEKLIAGLTPEQLAALEALDAQIANTNNAQLAQYGMLHPPRPAHHARGEAGDLVRAEQDRHPLRVGRHRPGRLRLLGSDLAGVAVRRPADSADLAGAVGAAPARAGLRHAARRPDRVLADASHIAMYLGNGLMVHAPRPGRWVTIAQAGSMPILGVVRPDGGAGTVQAPPVPNMPNAPKPSNPRHGQPEHPARDEHPDQHPGRRDHHARRRHHVARHRHPRHRDAGRDGHARRVRNPERQRHPERVRHARRHRHPVRHLVDAGHHAARDRHRDAERGEREVHDHRDVHGPDLIPARPALPRRVGSP